MKRVFCWWLIVASIVSCLLGIVYIVVQQDLRIGANDPQIQMAEDDASALSANKQIPLPGGKIDIAQSLAPFIMIFDQQGKVISSSAVLNNTTPLIPSGVFASVRSSGEDRLTWQPQTGVRIAAVVTKYNNGYFLVGRNLREVEKREDQLFMQIVCGWILTLGVSFVALFLFERKK